MLESFLHDMIEQWLAWIACMEAEALLVFVLVVETEILLYLSRSYAPTME
jgi:hypothetical protein